MVHTLIVFLGAGLGGTARFGVNVACARYCGIAFPWSTLIINIAGSTVMGLIAGYLTLKATEAWALGARLFLMTGVLGGFTTFSAFSLDAAVLWERGQASEAAAYVVGSVALSIAGLFAGLSVVRALT